CFTALDLVRWRIGQIRPMPFAGMDDQKAKLPRGRQYVAARCDGGLQPRHIISKGGAEPTGLEKIALHVDDDERRAVKFDGQRCRLGFKSHARHPDLLPRTDWKSARSGPATFSRQRGGKAAPIA